MTPEEFSAWEPFLKTVPLFAGLASQDLAHVAERMQALSLPKGSRLYSQGDEPDAFYIITSGQVRVVRKVDGSETVDDFLGRGETLGEGGLMTGEPRHNTVRLDSTCEFLKLLRKDFEEVLRENPSILMHISRILARRIVRAQNPTPGAGAQILALNAALSSPDRQLLSIHLALQLVSQTRRKVLLLDLRPEPGNLARFLGLQAPDAPADTGYPRDPSWVRPLTQPHPSGLDVLSLPTSALSGRHHSGLYHLLNFLREEHDLILVCLSNASGDLERSILAEADQAILAAGPATRAEAGRLETSLRSVVTEPDRIIGLWLGAASPDQDFLRDCGREILPWPDDLGARLERTGSPYQAMDGYPRTIRSVERLARRLGGLRLGLALGAGAALGYSLIGVLKVFQREHIPVDVVAGTSSGALIGSWLASGMDPSEMEAVAQRLDKSWLYENLFLDLTIPRAGIFAGETLLRFLRTFLGDKEFSQLDLPFACVATDIETGEEVVLRSGRVAEAVRASCGLPMIFTPFKLGGRYLVDGGLVDPVPTRVAADLGADILIAVNLTQPASERNPRRKLRAQDGLLEASLDMDFERLRELTLPAALNAPNMLQAFMQTLHTMEYQIARTRLEFAHIAIQPNLSAFDWTDTHRSREIIRVGERIAEEYAPQIKALLPFFTQLGKVPRRPSSPLRP
ncbi:MAG: patatin-like phospholipase family protein [Elusimicrobiota bacterium]